MFDVESDRTSASGIPVTGGQSGIWLAQQIEPDSSAYNIVFALDLHGDIDLDRLGGAVRQAVEEAGCLHVSVVGEHGRARQIPRAASVDVPVLDLRDAAAPEDAAAAWIAADRDRPADLAHGPLFAQELLRLADDRVWWYQRYHHILIDGMGVALVTRRAGELYTLGEQAPAPKDWAPARLVAADEATAPPSSTPRTAPGGARGWPTGPSPYVSSSAPPRSWRAACGAPSNCPRRTSSRCTPPPATRACARPAS